MAFVGEVSTELSPIEVENIGSFADLILSELPACDDLLVRQKLAATLREFCRETDACVARQSFVAHDAPRAWPDMFSISCVPCDMILGNVLDLTYDGRHIAFKVDYERKVVFANERPAHDVHVEITVSVVPAPGGEKCPKWFKKRYAEAICAGTLYHLLSMTKKPWSDPTRAVHYGNAYRNAIAEASYQRVSNDILVGGVASAIPCGGPFM